MTPDELTAQRDALVVLLKDTRWLVERVQTIDPSRANRYEAGWLAERIDQYLKEQNL